MHPKELAQVNGHRAALVGAPYVCTATGSVTAAAQAQYFVCDGAHALRVASAAWTFAAAQVAPQILKG